LLEKQVTLGNNRGVFGNIAGNISYGPPITCHIMRNACVTCVYVPKRVIVRHTAKQQLVSFIHVVLWGAHNVTHCKARCGTTTGIVFSCGTHERSQARRYTTTGIFF